MVATACLLLFRIDSESIGLDESFSVLTAASPDSRFWELVLADQARMSAYYVVLRPWLLLGDSMAWVRGLSVLFAILALPVVCAVGARLFNARAGVIAALLLAASPFFIRYGQEARAYSLLILLVSLSTLLLTEALARRSARWWLGYGGVAALSLYAHYFAGFVVLAQWIVIGLTRRQWSLRHVLGAAAVVGSAAISLLAIFIYTERGALSWIPAPSAALLVRVLRDLVGHIGPPTTPPVVLAAYSALMLGGIFLTIRSFQRGERPWRWLLVITWVLVPIAASYLLSSVRPMFVSRFLIVSLPGLVLTAGAVLASMRPRMSAVVLAITLVALGVPSLANWYGNAQKPQWREIVSALSDESVAGDALAVLPWYQVQPLVYYARRDPSLDLPRIVYPLDDWSQDPTPGADDASVGSVLSEAVSSSDRVWLVTEAKGGYPTAWMRAWEALAKDYREVSTQTYSGIDVTLFDSHPAASIPTTWLPGAMQHYTIEVQTPAGAPHASRSPYTLEVQIAPLQAREAAVQSYEFPLTKTGSIARAAIDIAAPDQQGWYVVHHSLVGPGGLNKELQSTRIEVTTNSAAWARRGHAAIGEAAPAHWTAGETQTFAVTIHNVGSTTWSATGPNPVQLGISFGGASDQPGDGWVTDLRIPLPRDVAPHETSRFSVTVRAPDIPGAYVLRHRLVREGVTWLQESTDLKVTVRETAPARGYAE
jgi:hypothetical protein